MATSSLDERLQMYVYYGTVSWQIIGIVVAVATLTATLPFLVGNQLALSPHFLWYSIFDELFAATFLLVGSLFWRRTMELGRRWVHWQNENYLQSLQYLIDIIEIQRPDPDSSQAHRASPREVRGQTYVIILGALVF